MYPTLLSLILLLLAPACYVVETTGRELPPRDAPPPHEAAPRRAHRPPPPDHRPPPADEPFDPPPPRTRGFHVPPDRVPPRGLCRIWFDGLPPDRQPAPMTCARAHRVARHHGGRVIWAASPRAHQDGEVASTLYGHVDLTGIPPDRLPPPGYCRVWLDGVPPDRQPPPARCPDAERDAHRSGGRLIYMPSSDAG